MHAAGLPTDPLHLLLPAAGVLWGLRVLKYQGTMHFKDVKNGIE